MVTVKKHRLKKQVKLCIYVIIGLIILISIPVGIYLFNSSKLSDLGYEKPATRMILKKHKQDYIFKVGKNKTLNAAFQSKDYKEKYLKQYEQIRYQNQNNFIKNINTLLDKKYTEEEVTLITSRGNDKEVSQFAKRDKVDDIQDYMVYDYAKLAYYDRYVAYQLKEREDEENTVTYVNIGLDKEYYQNEITIKKYSETILSNKYRKLDEKYKPDDLMKIKTEYAVDDEQYLTKVAAEAFEKMVKEAKKEGYDIIANSAYRSYQDQLETYELYKNTYGQNYVDNYVAKPGYSEHQTGLALDVASKNNKIFADSEEFVWMKKNSYKYGFIMRYPKSKENVTGYKYESWHYRYVGKKIAKEIYENDLTYDEYYVRYLANS